MEAPDDLKMDIVIGYMLRVGVMTAALVVFAGGVLYLLKFGHHAPEFQHFHGTPWSALNIAPVLRGVRELDGRSTIQLGILLLIATPIMRVVFCIVGFALQRDRIYVAVSSIVLAVLLYSLLRS